MNKINVPNPEVLIAGIRHAEEDLEHWNQAYWAQTAWEWDEVNLRSTAALADDGGPMCGTSACLAGHILLAQGMTWEELLEVQRQWEIDDVSVVGIAERALDALGFEPDDRVHVTPRDDFSKMVFGFTAVYHGYTGATQLARTRETLELLKDRITEATGIEL